MCSIQNNVCHVCTAIPNYYSTALEPSPSVTLYVAHNLYPLPYDPTILPQSQPILCQRKITAHVPKERKHIGSCTAQLANNMKAFQVFSSAHT